MWTYYSQGSETPHEIVLSPKPTETQVFWALCDADILCGDDTIEVYFVGNHWADIETRSGHPIGHIERGVDGE